MNPYICEIFNGMRVGISGTRGIPNAYGGFEQFAQFLSQGLVSRGHEVYVYSSDDHPYQEDRWNGVFIVHCKDREKTIGTVGQFLYDFRCFRDAARRDFDVLLQLGYTSSSLWHRFWPRRAINVVNMDGLEWKRSKYNRLTQLFLRRAERWAAVNADVLVADSIGIRDYIQERYDRESFFIPYGADIPKTYDASVPGAMGLSSGEYLLLVARMEPENNIETILTGWMASDKEYPLVLVGNTETRFGRYLTSTFRHDRLRFIGPVYDLPTLNALRHFARVYFHGHSVGGTNPSLLEAMACGCLVAAHDNIFNKAVLGNDAWYFVTPQDVTSLIESRDDSAVRATFTMHNLEKIARNYSWEKIIDDYEKLFQLPPNKVKRQSKGS